MSVQIIQGDCRDVLKTLPEESVHCVVTSPPYWGLRDYGTAQWVGGDMDCSHEGKPVQTDGTKSIQTNNKGSLTGNRGNCIHCGATRVDNQLGLEPTLGEHIDTIVDVFREVRRVLRKDGTVWLNYGDCYATSPNGWSAARYKEEGQDDRTHRDKPFSTIGGVLKAKDLCMMPARIAIALQEDGWWIRKEIIWAKKNPMPESANDRPTSSHEKVYLLTKSARYFYDAEAVKTPATSETTKAPDGWDTTTGQGDHGSIHKRGRDKGKKRGLTPRHTGHFNHTKLDETPRGEGANIRDVWWIATKPYTDAHFATFPTELVEPCIKAGCPIDGTVLDPFGGSGTVGLVADRLGRDAILIELNPDYSDMAKHRIGDDAGMFAEVS